MTRRADCSNWLRVEATAAGRQPEDIGVQGSIGIGGLTEAEWADRAGAWREVGATDLVIDTVLSANSSDASLNSVKGQIVALHRIREALNPQRMIAG